jgi:hypothetical protein
MELKYVKALRENDLKISDLPEDAQTGISEINKVLKGFAMIERKGRKPLPASIKKLQAMDKWVYYEILDYLHDTDNNDDDMPVDADDVLDDLKDKPKGKDEPKNDDVIAPDATGLAIDQELDVLYASDKKSFTIDEIKSRASKTYKEIWDNYEPGDDNGIVTSKYSFLENDDELFELKLK